MKIKRGDLVEFTDVPYFHYPPKDKSKIQFGVALESEWNDGSVLVMTANRKEKRAKYVHAYAWSGWMPENLEEIFAEINETVSDDWQDYE